MDELLKEDTSSINSNLEESDIPEPNNEESTKTPDLDPNAPTPDLPETADEDKPVVSEEKLLEPLESEKEAFVVEKVPSPKRNVVVKETGDLEVSDVPLAQKSPVNPEPSPVTTVVKHEIFPEVKPEEKEKPEKTDEKLSTDVEMTEVAAVQEKLKPVENSERNLEVSDIPMAQEAPVIPEPPVTPVVKYEIFPVVKLEEKEKPEKREEKLSTDVQMTEVAPIQEKLKPVEKLKAQKTEVKEKSSMSVNGDIAKEDQATKRRASAEVDTESPLKKLCQEVENTFPQHDSMINDYIQTATKNNIDEIQRHTEQLLAEIQTLRELAQKKEHEWNNILHLKKVKEEILLRLLRRKQVLSFEKLSEMNGAERTDPFDFLNQAKNLAIDKSDEISGLSIKQPGSTMNTMVQPVMPVTTHFNPMAGLPPPYDKAAHMHNMPKPVFPQPLMLPGPMPGFPRDMNGQLPTSFGLPMGRQGPTKDVKSIIADYRQRNPDITPRRGRRMKSILNPNMLNAPRPIAPKMDNMNNLNNLNMLFNNLDMNQKAMLERLQQMQAGNLPNSIFKDALVQFANMQQASSGLIPNRIETVTNRPDHHKERRRPERPHEEHANMKQPERLPSTSPRLPPPPPYPEISLLPVTTAQETTQAQSQNSLLHGILTKNCGEITITPVQPTPPEPPPEKPEEVVQLDDEESPPSEGEASGSPSGSGSGRLVIDEGTAEPAETPLCQGCRRRDAQFVCAGCANQWYCSRDCQVAAWDDHSEMCSG